MTKLIKLGKNRMLNEMNSPSDGKKFLAACIFAGITWIITGVFLIFLQNSDFFSITVGLFAASGAGFTAYSGIKEFKGINILDDIIFSVLFLFALFNLVKITSGRIALTCMILILSFLILQKGITDWRTRKCR